MHEVTLSKWLTTIRVILIISILGLTIYFNSFFNGFFADDYQQIVDNPSVHSLSNIPSFFTGSTFFTGTNELTGNYYKPIFTSMFALLYSVFGENAGGYHFFQVLIHICNALLVFVVFKSYTSRILALIFSLIFLTHPINTETVVYIANLQDCLYLFFGLLAFVLNVKYKSPVKYPIVGLLLLLSILSKETGALFLLILPLSSFLTQKGKWAKVFMVSTGVAFVYAYLRFIVAHVGINNLITAPIMQLSLSERLMHIPYIIFFYIKTFFFPKDLIVFQTAILKDFTINNFYIPMFIDLLFLLLITIAGVYLYKKYHTSFREYLFFSIWFLAGLSIHLQLIPIDGTVADRWFYFPIIGLLGMFLVFINAVKKKVNSGNIKKFALLGVLILLLVFSIRVMVRNANWVDQITLIRHDIQINKESYQLEEGYGLELMKEGKLDEAYPHLLRSTEIFPGVNNFTSLGVYYGNTKQFDKAKESFKRAMEYDNFALTYENYSLLLFLEKNYSECNSFTDTAVNKFPGSYKLWFYKSMCAYTIGNKDEALRAARTAYSIQQDATRQYVLRSILNNQPIDLSQL